MQNCGNYTWLRDLTVNGQRLDYFDDPGTDEERRPNKNLRFKQRTFNKFSFWVMEYIIDGLESDHIYFSSVTVNSRG